MATFYCTQCGTPLDEASCFCFLCGSKAAYSTRVTVVPGTQQQSPVSKRSFFQLFGLDPRVAFLTLVVDLMLNAGDIATLGLLVPVSAAAGIALGYIVYKAQINWYGDDKESAKIKAVIVGLLTAIPTPLPAILYVPSGVVGMFHNLRRKWLHT